MSVVREIVASVRKDGGHDWSVRNHHAWIRSHLANAWDSLLFFFVPSLISAGLAAASLSPTVAVWICRWFSVGFLVLSVVSAVSCARHLSCAVHRAREAEEERGAKLAEEVMES